MTTSLLAGSTDSSLGLERIQRGAPVLSHPMWQIFSCTRPPCLGCGDWRSGHAPSGLGRRRLASWSCACSRLRAGSMRSTTCAVCAWVCLTGSAHLVRPLGTGCPSECGSFVEFRKKSSACGCSSDNTTPHGKGGLAGGLARDPWGTRSYFWGTRSETGLIFLRFWGDSLPTTPVFYNIKKGWGGDGCVMAR